MKSLFTSIFAVAAWVFCTTALVSAQSIEVPTFFLKVDGIPGESQEPGFLDQIEVVSFKMGVQQKGVSDFGGGAGVGKSEFLPLRIFKYVDKASPALFLKCATKLGRSMEKSPYGSWWSVMITPVSIPLRSIPTSI